MQSIFVTQWSVNKPSNSIYSHVFRIPFLFCSRFFCSHHSVPKVGLFGRKKKWSISSSSLVVGFNRFFFSSTIRFYRMWCDVMWWNEEWVPEWAINYSGEHNISINLNYYVLFDTPTKLEMSTPSTIPQLNTFISDWKLSYLQTCHILWIQSMLQ